MLHLRNDLYSRLVTSAQKDRSLNAQFKKSIYSLKKISEANNPASINVSNAGNNSMPTSAPKFSKSNYSFDNSNTTTIKPDVASSRLETSAASAASNPNRFSPVLMRVTPSVKIEEKVDSLISNSSLSEILLDLEFAEQLLKKIKSKDTHNPKIPILEQTISRLKTVIMKKSSK